MDPRNRSLSRRLPGLLAAQRLDGRRHHQDLFTHRFAGTLPVAPRAGAEVPRHRLRRTAFYQQSGTELRRGPYVERVLARTPDVALLVGHLELHLEAAEARQVPDRRASLGHEGPTADCGDRETSAGRREWVPHDHCRSGADLDFQIPLVKARAERLRTSSPFLQLGVTYAAIWRTKRSPTPSPSSTTIRV
ncbi:hypothetical protein NITMOv2_1357 [Nitrospira moscoviensis]|uniref:Uncharacterized protein n=1 Tax=Nitrospira moscoviensis TaxID=42253 RepID=A0A0K2GA11_NITMO|nr:hypothetical protein NITMOv2_1357 [Nitrospira moscoviensis]